MATFSKMKAEYNLDEANLVAEALQAHRHALYASTANLERGSDEWQLAGGKVLALEMLLRSLGQTPHSLSPADAAE